jgi:hypothetical protein
VNDMTNETSPIYEALVAETGNPVPATPVDRSYKAILAEAESIRSGAASARTDGAAPQSEASVVSLPNPSAPAAEETPSLAGAANQAG